MAWPSWLLAAALGSLYAAHHPPAADLAAQTARAQLVARAGRIVWWSRWYGGVETPGYGLVSPTLMAWLGVTAVGVLALLLTGVLAPPLLHRARRPTAGALALVAAQALNLWSGRTTFALGGALALGALALADRRVHWPAFLLAALATLTSPVAGLLLGVPLGVIVLCGPGRRRRVTALLAGLGALMVLGVLALWFPSGGNGPEPFAGWLLRDCLLVAVPLLLLPVGARVRVGALLTVVLVVGAYAVSSPLGSNASRLPLLLAAPVAVAALRLPGALVAVAAVLLAYLPVQALRDDLRDIDPARTTAAYYAPLLAGLDAEPAMRTHRVEVVEPADHWHAARIAPRYPLARGWQRQADTERSAAIYGSADPLHPPRLTAQSYRRFLDDFAVAIVAVAPAAPVDFASRQEWRLVLGGLPYLEDAGTRGAWRLFRVRDPAPMASGPGEVSTTTDDAVLFHASAPGTVRLRVWWSPALVAAGPTGAVVRKDGHWTAVEVRTPGDYRLHGSFP